MQSEEARTSSKVSKIKISAIKELSMITAGNMQGLNPLFHVLINPRDEVILSNPCFSSHHFTYENKGKYFNLASVEEPADHIVYFSPSPNVLR